MASSTKYDYIIAGAGCAGLSLAVRMILDGGFQDKKILLVDKEKKTKNDRTWCFWETEPGIFESIVYQSWEKVNFYGEEFQRVLALAPYRYKMIRGIDFYTYCMDLINRHPAFEIRYGQVSGMLDMGDHARLSLEGEDFEADYIFNSILFEKPVIQNNEVYMLQHFKGWIIETEDPVFEPAIATLMDFRPDQAEGTTFAYVMPFSTNRALVEYTLFSNELLHPPAYDAGLRDYIEKIRHIHAYRVVEEEFGVIPMTNHRFPANEGRIIHIGTAGGQTKASSGYTFQFIQKHTASLVEKIRRQEPIDIPPTEKSRRFHFYDSILLNILYYDKFPGKTIFTDLFKKNDTAQVLKFLDNETSLREEWRIISSLPTIVFLKAAMQQLY